MLKSLTPRIPCLTGFMVCGAGLNYKLEQDSLIRIVKLVFKGSGGCPDVAWRSLGLPMPVWASIIFFVGVLAPLSLTR